jgi:hypothetical protein
MTSIFASTRQKQTRKSDVSADMAAAISSASMASPPIGDSRLQFLVHTRLVVNSSADGDYSPARSGIIYLATDVGIKGLKGQIWSLLRSNKFANNRMSWEDYTAKLIVRVKWMTGNVRVPEAVLETDVEVRTAIKFMAERGFKDLFSVTCYLKAKEGEVELQYQNDNEGHDAGYEADGGWGRNWYEEEEPKGRGSKRSKMRC